MSKGPPPRLPPVSKRESTFKRIHIHRKPPQLESAHVIYQASGLAELDPREETIPLTIGGPAVEDSVSPRVEEPVHTVVEHSKDLATPPVEQLIHPVSEVLTATTPFLPPIHQATIGRFSLSLFQRPTLLDALVRRLRKKHVIVHSWRIADQPSEWQGAPPTRSRLKDLDSSQIYEYLKSGGKSVQPAKEKVGTSLPLYEIAWLILRRHYLH